MVVLGLVSVCDGITELVPLAVKPVTPPGLVAVHINVVPLTLELMVMLCVAAPLHIVWTGGSITAGVGVTTILEVDV